MNPFPATLALLVCASAVLAQDDPARTLFTNVHVFDGLNEARIENASVLVEGNLITTISTDALDVDGATVIDGGGRTLMPGIIDSHIHLAIGNISVPDIMTELPGYLTIRSAVAAEQVLDQGITTVRDMGGETFTLKRAIDEGLIPGPRVYPSGAFITQTSGHFDFRARGEANPSLTDEVPYWSRYTTYMVDGPDRVLAAARENLRLGASQLKLAIGGGVSSPTDPIDTTQFSYDEIKAAVDAAENWGTYVTVHGYTPRAVNIAIDAGVKVIEHGQLLDRATVERMAKEGIWLSYQPFTLCEEPHFNAAQNAKQAIICKGTAQVYEWMKEFPDLKVTHGTDTVMNPVEGLTGTTEQLERLEKWFTPYEILKMATGNTSELLKLSGPRNPYQDGDLGVVAEGAYADLLLVDGNPLDGVGVLGDTDNLRIIMKDGEIYKNTLSE
ncbi:imidazolonepropionase-like amidohydrolase [Aliiruegeria haliotis]|uniref:Imidazolonepropionase-like amidohydrolase n=1 Tax=Aliiruegeria haliotis TaxID=1280846 RepID=A0A2T0RF15_9RHOB|nr:amidohydrolase family protein [Aliiruegeria haliotis]PRY19763.1 imidazolonepropionase-like amidohydrolase [Aliiruegeria haliotis]